LKPLELIDHLNQKGARLYLEGDKLLCDAPKNAVGPELLQEIKANKAELMALLGDVEARGDDGGQLPEFHAVARGKKHPLSFAQKRMMVLHAIQTNESAFNICLALAFGGDLDTRKLETAVQRTTERHELLRTGFEWDGDHPTQSIANDATVNIAHADMRHTEADESDRSLIDLINRERAKPFDIGRAPLFRATLVARPKNRYVLVLVSHYLVADEASMLVFARDIGDFYNKSASEENSEDARRFQYLDYVAWEKQFLDSGPGKEQLRFWVDRLKNRVPDTHGNSANYRIRLYPCDSIDFELPGVLTRQLEQLSHERQVSLFMMLYALYAVSISHMYGLDRFFCGSPIVNRARMELEKMAGYFANTLVFANQVTDDDAFVKFLGETREEVLGAFSNADIPFEYALEKAGVTANPFTRFMFTYAEEDTEE